MTIFYHNKSKITEVVSTEVNNFSHLINQNVVRAFLDLADKFRDEILVWCHENEKENLNIDEIEKLFHHKKLLFSFYPSDHNYFGRLVGYIEDSPYVKVNKTVTYATWQMSSKLGAVHACVINACKNDLIAENNFDYFLNSFARRAMRNGLFCYSEPKLRKYQKISIEITKSTLFEFFKFTKQHYRIRWVFVLFLNLMIFEKKFPLFPFLISFFFKRRNLNSILLNKIPLVSNKKIINKGTIDVLIPTIGRKDYLFDVLTNLECQTHLPENVIIIEQNPLENSQSDLDYIENKKWPFKIKHYFTHQSGACNARNIGLSMVESEFTFLADDDIVFENDLLENVLKKFQTIGNDVFSIACRSISQTIEPQLPMQFSTFGAGHAFVKSSCFNILKFRAAFEFGYGEDADFGMQLRNSGFDIIYISNSQILHLKAPMGGFRTKHVLRWQDDSLQPKPSPTVMLFRILHDTDEQLLCYKLTLFLKNSNPIILFNPLKYIKIFQQKWDRSIFWANELNKQEL